MGYYRCCEVGNHPLTNQDEHFLGPLQILDQNSQESAKPHHLQDATEYQSLCYHISLPYATSFALLFPRV
jgi:hypothetical protein